MAPVIVDTYEEPSWKLLAVPTTSLAAVAAFVLVSHFSYWTLALFGAFLGLLRVGATTHLPKVRLRVENGELYVDEDQTPRSRFRRRRDPLLQSTTALAARVDAEPDCERGRIAPRIPS